MLQGARLSGYRAAQLAALGTMFGGAFDFAIRRLLPHHERFLGAGTGVGAGAGAGEVPPEVPAQVAALVLLLLNTLGVALVVVGGLALALLHAWRRHGIRWAAWAAAIGVAVAAGANAWGISRVGSMFMVGPLLFPILALGGVALALRAEEAGGARRPGSADGVTHPGTPR